MSRILVIGFPPPPYRQQSKVEAAHYRTWQFIQPLLDDGHTIHLCVPRTEEIVNDSELPANLSWQALPFDTPGWPRRLRAVQASFGADCAIGVDFYPALYATRLAAMTPLWLDLYGDPLTISQVARFRAGTDQGIGTAVALLQHVLKRGDIFSTCGLPQQHMLMGELAMCHRLNARTHNYLLANVIYPGAPSVTEQAPEDQRARLRQTCGLPPDAFAVLWCGGYNTWTDVATLFQALEQAMNQNARVHFVSVGASSYQSRKTQYDQLMDLISQSRYAERYHLLGWRPWREIPGFYRLADVGINIDALHTETIYGTRTRLVEMLSHDLPVISSEGCELSYLLDRRRAGLSFAVGDGEQLAKHIVQLAEKPILAEQLRQAGRTLIHNDLSFHVTTKALRAWAYAPRLAPDRAAASFQQKITAGKYRMRTMARQWLWRIGLSGRR